MKRHSPGSFDPGLTWIDLGKPVYGTDGEPVHERGIVPGEPGLYFVGLHFLYSLSSTMIHGVARDAERIADTIGKREQAQSSILSAATPRARREPRDIPVAVAKTSS